MPHFCRPFPRERSASASEGNQRQPAPHSGRPLSGTSKPSDPITPTIQPPTHTRATSPPTQRPHVPNTCPHALRPPSYRWRRLHIHHVEWAQDSKVGSGMTQPPRCFEALLVPRGLSSCRRATDRDEKPPDGARVTLLVGTADIRVETVASSGRWEPWPSSASRDEVRMVSMSGARPNGAGVIEKSGIPRSQLPRGSWA
jgi:hypothetical protein